MRITSKGQVTIPQELRESLGFLPETEVEFLQDGKELRVVRKKSKSTRGRALLDHMRQNAGSSGLTTKQIMELTRG